MNAHGHRTNNCCTGTCRIWDAVPAEVPDHPDCISATSTTPRSCPTGALYSSPLSEVEEEVNLHEAEQVHQTTADEDHDQNRSDPAELVEDSPNEVQEVAVVGQAREDGAQHHRAKDEREGLTDADSTRLITTSL